MSSNARGSISGIVVCLVLSLMAVVGLVFDGGKVIETYGELASLSASAARLGGQEIEGIQDGNLRINKSRAREVMTRYLGEHQLVGTFVIGDTDISVTINRDVKMSFFQLLGVETRTVQVVRSVTVVKG